MALLVTCAVRAHPEIPTSNGNVESRLAEYGRGLASLMFYSRIGPIVVCEGSGFPEQRFRAAVASARTPPFEYVSLSTTGESARRGKGLAELDLIAGGLDQSEQLADSDRILKVTGRYEILNGRAIVATLLRGSALPDVQANLYNRLTYADSRFFTFSQEFFRRSLYPKRGDIDDRHSVWLEHVLARAILSHVASYGSWAPLPYPVRAAGASGTTGAAFHASLARYSLERGKHWLKLRSLGRAG